MSKKVAMRILRVGKHFDSAGKEHDFSGETLKKIAEGFNFSGVEDATPDIISHDNRSPRVGFVRKVYVGDDGNSLFAESEIHDDFAQAIYEGFYPSVSASLDFDKTKILHIAHLGRQKPAIKGLGLPIVEFSEPSGEQRIDLAEINLELFEQVSFATIDGIRDALYDVRDKVRTIFETVRNANGEKIDNFSETQKGDNSQTETADFAEYSALKEKYEKLQAQLSANKEKEAADFAEGLINAGKILPRQKASVVKDYLTADTANFAEFKAEYENLPVSPLFNAPQITGANEKDPADFSSQELADKAAEFAARKEKEGIKMEIIDAIRAVRKGVQ